MPPPTWPDRDKAAQALGAHDVNGPASGLLYWATWAVEGIYHVADVYAGLQDGSQPIAGFHIDALDVVYARSGTSSAITALDLCAAALAHVHCGWTADRHADMRTIYHGKAGSRPYDRAPASAQCWLDAVRSDPNYDLVLEARHPFMHGALPRHVSVSIGTGAPELPGRVAFRVGSPEIGRAPLGYTTADLIERSRALATGHLTDFMRRIVAGEI